MAYTAAYSHITLGSVPAEIKDEVWLSFESWVGFLQSFPGLMDVRMAARELPNGDIRFLINTRWEYPEQLQAWAASIWAADKLLMAFPKPAYDVTGEAFMDLD